MGEVVVEFGALRAGDIWRQQAAWLNPRTVLRQLTTDNAVVVAAIPGLIVQLAGQATGGTCG